MKALFCTLVLTSLAFAGPHHTVKTFQTNCDRTWQAAKIAVREHYDVLNLNDEAKLGSFTTGNIWSGVRTLAFSLSGSGESCNVDVTGHFSGMIHNDKGDLFDRIDKALGQVPATPAKDAKPELSTPAVSSTATPAPVATVSGQTTTATAAVAQQLPNPPEEESLGDAARKARAKKAAERQKQQQSSTNPQ